MEELNLQFTTDLPGSDYNSFENSTESVISLQGSDFKLNESLDLGGEEKVIKEEPTKIVRKRKSPSNDSDWEDDSKENSGDDKKKKKSRTGRRSKPEHKKKHSEYEIKRRKDISESVSDLSRICFPEQKVKTKRTVIITAISLIKQQKAEMEELKTKRQTQIKEIEELKKLISAQALYLVEQHKKIETQALELVERDKKIETLEQEKKELKLQENTPVILPDNPLDSALGLVSGADLEGLNKYLTLYNALQIMSIQQSLVMQL